MAAITFDTHQFIKDLQAKGFQPEQAEGISDALKNVLVVAEIATKQDIQELRLEIKAEIAPLKWMTGATAAGVIAILMKTFF
jgi:UDP-N-acetylenolpyruvoylglucosamine reductase